MLTLIGIFLLNFMMKFADRLIGKGIPVLTILELIVYNLAWMLVLIIPMAVLVATIMAFGNMAQENEIAILKASGVSLYRTMLPPFLASIFLAIFLVWFNNYVYPNANHAARILMYDISRTKPAVSLVPGVISDEIPNYSILARKIDNRSNKLYKLTIYDKSDFDRMTIITAREGKIYFNKSQSKLFLDLYNGEIHISSTSSNKDYRKLTFTRHKVSLPADQFSLRQTTDLTRGDRELGAFEMQMIVDSLQKLNIKHHREIDELAKTKLLNVKRNSRINSKDKFRILMAATDNLNVAKSYFRTYFLRLEANQQRINRYEVEIHKKYAIPIASIIFILIGAPLGTMLRKGGYGVAAGVSLLFFLIYWAFLIGGEKLADRSLFSPLLGIWSANIVLGIFGIYLTRKSAKERISLDFSFAINLFRRKRKDENS